MHCYADAETKRFAGELTTEEARRMIDDLANFKWSEVPSSRQSLSCADGLSFADDLFQWATRHRAGNRSSMADPQE